MSYFFVVLAFILVRLSLPVVQLSGRSRAHETGMQTDSLFLRE